MHIYSVIYSNDRYKIADQAVFDDTVSSFIIPDSSLIFQTSADSWQIAKAGLYLWVSVEQGRISRIMAD
jgi:hypothetical protein